MPEFAPGKPRLAPQQVLVGALGATNRGEQRSMPSLTRKMQQVPARVSLPGSRTSGLGEAGATVPKIAFLHGRLLISWRWEHVTQKETASGDLNFSAKSALSWPPFPGWLSWRWKSSGPAGFFPVRAAPVRAAPAPPGGPSHSSRLFSPRGST